MKQISGLEWSVTDWVFFAEGGAHILLAPATQSLAVGRQLLRIRKSRLTPLSDVTCYLQQLREVYVPVFGEGHVLIPDVVCLSSSFVTDIFRTHRIQMDCHMTDPLTYALLIENVYPADGSLFIEVKPKCPLRERPNLPCRVTLEESKTSADPYDPSDLFSSDSNVIQSGVWKLLSTRFCRVFDKTWKFEDIHRRLVEFFSQHETREILSRLQTLQKVGTAKFACKALELMKKFPGFSENGDIAVLTDPETFLSEKIDTSENAFRWIRRFLIARTAMDVSFLINFHGEEISRFCVVDLDLKPASKIPFYAEQFEKAVSSQSLQTPQPREKQGVGRGRIGRNQILDSALNLN